MLNLNCLGFINSSVLITIESLKQCIVAFATRIRRYKERFERHWQNRTFCSNQRTFYRHLCQDASDYAGIPDNHQVMMFWRNLFEKNSDVNLNCIWLSQWREKFAGEMDASDDEININNELFVKALKGLQNWASSGPDGIQGFWWKKLASTHEFLCLHFHQLLVDNISVPA